MKKIRFVVATRVAQEQFPQTALGRSLALHASPGVEQTVFAENRQGLPVVYNQAIEQAREQPAVLVFVHDDVHLVDFHWALHLRQALQRFDLVGLAGNVRRLPAQPSWAFATPDLQWDSREHLSGTVGHGRGFPPQNISRYGASPREVKLLDGLLLACDSQTLHARGLRFDERFAFHFYDMDFCREAELRGLKLGTWPISVIHESGGNFRSAAWKTGYDAYLRKWNEG